MQFKVWLKKNLLKRVINKTDKIKIVCGASNTKFDGWVSFNIDTLNITKENDFEYFFSERRIDNILLEHVVEHLKYDEFIIFLTVVKKYLKKGGIIRIAVPDGNHPSEYVRELTGVNGMEPGAHDHKYFYRISDMVNIASNLNYKLNKIEYFDSKGTFRTSEYNFDNGYISRCSKNYRGRFTNDPEEYRKMTNSIPLKLQEQFKSYGISYVSLLVDFLNE